MSQKEASRRYYTKHRDRLLQTRKDNRKVTYAKNRDKELAQKKIYYSEKKEQILNYKKEKYDTDKEPILANRKEYYRTHKEKFVAYNKTEGRKVAARKFHLSPNGRFSNYRGNAKTRDIPFELSFGQFMMFWMVPCFVTGCTSVIETIGIDRIDNTLGYILGNIRPCCEGHNKMLLDNTDAETYKLASTFCKWYEEEYLGRR